MSYVTPKTIAAIAGRYELDAVYVFGSRATEIASLVHGEEFDCQQARLETSSRDPDLSSDVDIGVQPARSRTLSVRERVSLAGEFEDCLGVGRVDLIVLQEASAFLALEVIRGELLCNANRVSQAEYELYVLRRAADLAVFEQQRREQILTEGAR